MSHRKHTPIKRLSYPTKILVAWGEAISGNKKIRDWLIKNGYPELGLFCFALRNKDDARQWLLSNGYPHLMALINGGEGNEEAIKWLDKYKFHILARMAEAIDGNKLAMRWLIDHNYRIFAVLAQKMKVVKDEIEDDNQDPHKISKE